MYLIHQSFRIALKPVKTLVWKKETAPIMDNIKKSLMLHEKVYKAGRYPATQEQASSHAHCL